jgi:sterol desaturase/sphingolipid hydroxylase (fatty acid hydroxylase superfamily)
MIEYLHNVRDYLQHHFVGPQNVIFYICILVIAVLVARQFERRWPIDPDLPKSEVVTDWKVIAVNVALAWIVGSLTAVCGAAIVNAAGGGFIPLRTDGWWFVLSLLVFLLVADLNRYVTHRLCHAVPFLWALHSFHHSAEAMTFATGARHHWMDRVLLGTLLPFLSILFRVPIELVTVSSFIIFLPDGCAHLNVRFPLGRAITWLNSPQWHRIHHSVQPEHFNKNFASVLPLWDILFGTAWIPDKDEYPATGLVPGEKCDVVTSIVWPFRHYLRRLKFRTPVWPRLGSSEALRKVYAKVSDTQNT